MSATREEQLHQQMMMDIHDRSVGCQTKESELAKMA